VSGFLAGRAALADSAFMKDFVKRPTIPQPTSKPKVTRKPPTVAAMAPQGSPNPQAMAAVMKAAAAASSIGGAMASRGKK
jgi:hypothetical protein